MQKYDWYTEILANESLEQGDIIEKCNVIIPNAQSYDAISNGEISDINVIEINGIVLSQSCDIANNKVDSIILCPITPLKDIEIFKNSRDREALRRGNSPAYHLLNKLRTATLLEDYYVVSFHHIYSVPKKFVETFIKSKPRKRLQPPYREHLSQSFARYFMRVGLPSDIPREEIEKYKF